MSLAIFDLDNTLLSIDSDHAWGEFLLEQGAVDPIAYREANERFMADYNAGTLDMAAFLEMALKPLADNTPEQLAAWHQQFMASKIEPNILPKAEELLARHRTKGDTLLIVTATNLFITAPIAERLGVDGQGGRGRRRGEPEGAGRRSGGQRRLHPRHARDRPLEFAGRGLQRGAVARRHDGGRVAGNRLCAGGVGTGVAQPEIIAVLGMDAGRERQAGDAHDPAK